MKNFSKKKRPDIEHLFTEAISEIFNHIVFAFVCGSVARGEVDAESDIDFFICTKERVSKKEKDQFILWYKEIHNQFGMRADLKFPGEIMSIDELDAKLKIAKSHFLKKPSKSNLYDGMVWAGMLGSDFIYFIGDFKKFFKRRKQALSIVTFWKRRLLNEFKQFPPDLFLKKFISEL